jgi:hypothetical protein
MGEIRNAHKSLVAKPERKRPFGRLDIDRRMRLEWMIGK